MRSLEATLDRRGFLKASGGAGAGLIIGLALPAQAAAATATQAAGEFNPFVRIDPNGTVTVIVKHLDKGQ
ncbi:MAG: twin-arginine translocation signal domain-containing protein, partial [Pseudomonadales bacterium]|nr:twin-arginine translocation signal domain-containing protein [Pseudomonadales bacterium]